MHPLFLLLPFGLCAVFTFASVFEVTEDWRDDRPQDRFFGAVMIALSFASTIVCAAPIAIWLAEGIAQ
jgi:hypothetical protein